jgi:hypothetical protein
MRFISSSWSKVQCCTCPLRHVLFESTCWRAQTPSRGYSPSQPRKPRIVSVERNPLGAGFDRERCIPGIWHQISRGVRFPTKSRKDRPMPWPRFDEHTVGRFHQHLAKSNAFGKAARSDEYFWVGYDADYPAQHLPGNTVARVSMDNRVQPTPAKGVLARIGPKRMNKNIDVRKDQRFDIRSSRSLERFRSTPGKVPPDTFETGRRKRARGAERGSARTAFSPSCRLFFCPAQKVIGEADGGSHMSKHIV